MRYWLGVGLLLCSLTLQANCLSVSRLQGVNLAGAEFNAGKLPRKMFTDYTYPGTATLDYFRLRGMNLIRLPILWERYQPQAYGELDSANLTQLKKLVQYARQYDLCLLVDVHNFGAYAGKPLSSYEDPAAMLFDLWHRLRLELNDESYWAYGLMNEPAKVSRQAWADIAKSVVGKLRASGASGLIVVPGGNWSGAHSWYSASASDPSNAELFAAFRDPLARMVFEMHQYVDSDYSGTKTDCISVSKMQAILSKATAWALNNNQQLLLGEFGVDGSEGCLAVLDSMLTSMQGSAWRGWSYWAAGSWWGSYPFSIQPLNGVDKPQMAVLAPYLK